MASTARLDELKKKFDENPRRYFAPLANEHRKSGDLDQAISLCRAHLPQQPAHISGHIVLGQALFEAGQLDESRAVFHTALELDPENLIALRSLGDIARGAGDVATARSWYTRVLEVDPRNDEIVQLVRELGAPGSTPAPAMVREAEDASLATAAPPEPLPAPPSVEEFAPVAPAPDADARFAPLAIDEIDMDGDFLGGTEAPAAPAMPDPAPESAAAIELDGDWSAHDPSVALPSLDESAEDPFAMPHSAGAEALFDPGQDAGDDDALIRDLAGHSATDLGELEAAPEPADAWAEPEASAPAPEPPAPPAAMPAESGAAAGELFEDGSFQLENAETTSPFISEASEDASVDAAAEQDAIAQEPHAAEEHAAVAGEASQGADRSPGDGSAPVAEMPAIEDMWPVDTDAVPASGYAGAHPAHETHTSDTPEPAVGAADDALGLEVMEFVPPDRTESSASAPPAAEPDPLLGRMPEIAAAADAPPPAAFVTETMAELYLQQGFRNEALAVYRELLARNPHDDSLRDRIEQIERGSMSSIGMATLSENVVESALRRQSSRPARSVRSFFASLAGRRPPARVPNEVAGSAAADGAPAADGAAAGGPSEAAPNAATPGASDEAPAEAPRTAAAAEMATFDPFAPEAAPDGTPAQPGEDGGWSAADGEEAVAEHEGAPSLDTLFPQQAATPRAEAAAETLATAFGRSEPQGRPTRAASNELSLDHVFRGSPGGAPPADGGFSFDQFFSDAPSATGDGAAIPATSQPASGNGGDTHDIEQFTAWLEGLKKK